MERNILDEARAEYAKTGDPRIAARNVVDKAFPGLREMIDTPEWKELERRERDGLAMGIDADTMEGDALKAAGMTGNGGVWNREGVLMTDSNGAKPVFNMGRAGRRWAREWQTILTDFAEAQASLKRYGLTEVDSGNDDLTLDQDEEVVRLMRMIDDASELQDKLVSEVLVSVPDDWLVPDASECHVDYIREARWPDVIAAVQEAREETSKN